MSKKEKNCSMKIKHVETIVVGGIEFKVLYKDLVPRVSEEEYQRLKDDIAENGVMVPVALDEKKGVIDGINRLRAVSELEQKSVPFHIHYGLDKKEKRDLSIKLNCLRRHLSKDERLDIAISLRKDKYSFRRIGAVLNLSHETIRRHLKDLGDTQDFPDTNIGKDGIERPVKVKRKSCVTLKNVGDAKKAFEGLSTINGKLKPFDSIIDVKTLSKKIKDHKINNVDTSDCSDIELGQAKLLLGDFIEKGNEIADESVDLIFTDPPYSKDALFLWDALGEFAQRVLKPGGVLLSYSGNMFLPQIHEMLGRRLKYFWTFAIRHTGGNTFVRNINIQQTYKPVIGYCKPPFNPFWHPFCDMVSGGRSKENHEWEQSEEEAQYYIKNMCPKNGTICDPMFGSGSSILAGMSLGMDCIGIEIDTTAFATAKERIANINKTIGKKAA